MGTPTWAALFDETGGVSRARPDQLKMTARIEERVVRAQVIRTLSENAKSSIL